jgi:hypothetical protein
MSDRRARTIPARARTAAPAQAMAMICNHERCSGVLGAHG